MCSPQTGHSRCSIAGVMLTPASRLDNPQCANLSYESRCGTTRFALVTTDAPQNACWRCRLRATNGWFDDEIAIDFPSLHAAVERMRACFVAASAECDPARRLSTELHLSPREAFNGVTVPLDVPVRKLCLVVRRARRDLVGSVRRVRRQRRSPRPPSRATRRPAARAGRRSICPLGFCSVRSAHARRSARRLELITARLAFYRLPFAVCRSVGATVNA